jgi:hypothetical protein
VALRRRHLPRLRRLHKTPTLIFEINQRNYHIPSRIVDAGYLSVNFSPNPIGDRIGARAERYQQKSDCTAANGHLREFLPVFRAAI